MPDRDDQLAELLIRWEDAKAAGRPLTPQQLCRDTPTLLAPFTKLLKQLGRVDPVFDGAEVATADRIDVIDAGRFDPLAYHNEGGLGVVYLAEDSELRRPVALKWMKPLPGLDPIARRRFIQEAEITGKLEHPGIAPVYGAGHDGGGRPYYAMRFIHGITLGEAVERFHALPASDPARPVEFARLLRSFVSVCQTVAYAHARGVIHRDLKPGNVMLGPYGETLVVDWGLAKRVDLPDPHDTVDTGYAPVKLELAPGGGTVYGQVKGSPAYMAPEQARGENHRVGPAADVYALGATLYAILTGRPPYSGTTASDIVDQVKRAAPPPPRKVAARVPRPLDAICRKAMSRDASNRYSTPKALADDIESWLADEPVTAYRDGLSTRGRRWVKRHRTAVATAVVALFVLGVALAVVVPLLAAKNRELADRKEALEKANTELERANGELTRSYAEIEAGFEDAGTLLAKGTVVMGQPQGADGTLSPEQILGWLRDYRAYLTRFVTRHDGNPRMRAQVAAALLKCHEIAILDLKPAEAAALLTRAAERFAALATENPTDRDARFGQALCRAHLGEAAWRRGEFAAGRKQMEDARAELETLAADPTPLRLALFHPDPSGVFAVESPATRLAELTLLMTAEFDSLDNAAMLFDKSAPRKPRDPVYRSWLATARDRLTGGKPVADSTPLHTQVLVLRLDHRDLAGTDDPARIRAFRDRAAALAARVPWEPQTHQLVATADRWLTRAAQRAGRRDEAIQHIRHGFGVADLVYRSWEKYDPFGVRDGALIERTLAAEALADLSAEARDDAVAKRTAGEAAIKALAEESEKFRNEQLAGMDLLADSKSLSLDQTLDAVGLFVRVGRRLAVDPSNAPLTEIAFAAPVKLLKRQLARGGDGRAFELALFVADCQLAWVYARLLQDTPAKPKPYRDEFAEAEATIARLSAERPGDRRLLTVEAYRLLLRSLWAGEQGQFELALATLAKSEAAYDEAARSGFAHPDLDTIKDGLVLTRAGLLSSQAEKLAEGRPAEKVAAVALLDKAIATVEPLIARRPNPFLSPDERARQATIATLATQALSDFRALRQKLVRKK